MFSSKSASQSTIVRLAGFFICHYLCWKLSSSSYVIILVLLDAALHFRLGSDLCWSQILIFQGLFLILNWRIKGQLVQALLSLLVEDLTRWYFVVMDPHLLKCWCHLVRNLLR